jgi:hypothetical protein
MVIEVDNRRCRIDSANTFGGTHFADPRQVYVEVRYRFHYRSARSRIRLRRLRYNMQAGANRSNGSKALRSASIYLATS